ncbi:MAG: hypothetical protein LUM44_18270 [Pyrinomonadaceae bacterium]|nr:hypothetical protein [Pyrinomonadaceae bacterium]
MNENSFFRSMVYRGTCYGSPAVTVEIKFDSGDKISCDFSEGLKKKNIFLDRPVVETFLTKIFEIIEKEEILTDLRSANVRHHAEVEWRNIDFINTGNSGVFKAFSNEWFIDQIEEYIENEAETPESRERYQKILDKKPHRHALEIYRTVKDFTRKYFM